MPKQAWLCGAAGAVLTMAATATAQTAAPAPGSTQLEEVIVTAQKVRSDVQKTPIAIQTVSGDAITSAGVNDAKDLNRLVSALSVQASAGGGSSFFIRGVGTANANANTDSGVAVSLDQMYFSRAYGPDLSFYDIQRIEVLKGPQGTLYGRNATGGAINIISTKPTIGKYEGYARIELGNYGEVRSNAAINLPITDTLAARIAIQTNEHDGYLKDGYDDSKTRSARAHILWKPTDNISLLLTAEYGHSGGKGAEALPAPGSKFLQNDSYQGFATSAVGNPVRYFSAPGSCYPGCVPAGFLPGNPADPAHHLFTDNGYNDITIQSFRADLEWSLGAGTLSVVPSILKTDYRTLFHNSSAPFFNRGQVEQQSIEVRLASPQQQRLTWLVGAFGQHEKQSFEFLGVFSSPFIYQSSFAPDVQDHAEGVFAQTSFKVLPRLSLTTGIRYSDENKDNHSAVGDNASLIPPLALHSVAPINKEHASAPTYRAGLEWQPTSRNLLYASYATGFHSGGLQLGQPPVRPICVPVLNGTPQQFSASVAGCDASGTYRPERLKAYTIGSKNRFLDNRLQINLEAYDWDYTDLQFGTIGLSNPGQTNQVVANAGRANIKGVDVDSRAQITSADVAGLSINYNKSKYGMFEFYNYIVGPFPPQIGVLTGRPFVNAPDLTFTANYQHIFTLPAGGTVTPSVSAQYSSKVVFTYPPLNQPLLETHQPSFTKIDATLTYHDPKDRFEAQLFVRNLTDETTINASAGTSSITNEAYVYIAAPRTFGGSVQVRF